MTAVVEYISGFCGAARHDRCRGDFGSAVCQCACGHRPAEPEPEPELVVLHHCPTCTCDGAT